MADNEERAAGIAEGVLEGGAKVGSDADVITVEAVDVTLTTEVSKDVSRDVSRGLALEMLDASD